MDVYLKVQSFIIVYKVKKICECCNLDMPCAHVVSIHVHMHTVINHTV